MGRSFRAATVMERTGILKRKDLLHLSQVFERNGRRLGEPRRGACLGFCRRYEQASQSAGCGPLRPAFRTLLGLRRNPALVVSRLNLTTRNPRPHGTIWMGAIAPSRKGGVSKSIVNSKASETQH